MPALRFAFESAITSSFDLTTLAHLAKELPVLYQK
jgi:hypothetical protein